MLRKIALFIGSIIPDYESKITRAMAQCVDDQFALEVYSSVGSTGESYFHKENDKKMVNIPCLRDYAGIIIAPDTFSFTSVYEEIVKKIIEEASCPVICLRYRDDRFFNILVDDYGAMECMVKHFIEVHKFHKICHMTGLLELEDARLRLKSYQDTMEKYKLPVTEHMIFEGNYWTDRGDAAVEWFLSDGPDNMPQAIVCANDYMAISVVKALKNRGIRIPEDICVSGFDNIDEVLYSVPRITSMNVPAEDMGKAAVQILERLLRNETVEKDTYLPVVPCFEGSCGCKSQAPDNHSLDLLERITYLNNTIQRITYLNCDYESCLTYEELIDCALRYSTQIEYEQIYICLCKHDNVENGHADDMEDWDQYTETMILYSILSRGESSSQFLHEEFPRSSILPDEHRADGKPIYILPLHYKSHCFGYAVIKAPNPEKLDLFFILWLQGLSGSMDRIYLQRKNKAYLEFAQQSRLDPLTGLYNRREMDHILRRNKYDSTRDNLYIMSLDLDGLKIINDTYGHLEGDNVLKALADILKKVSNGHVSAARIGGDEFLLCITAKSKETPLRIQAEIQSMMNEYNKSASKPYILSASIGYAKFTKKDGIIRCMEKADQRMYAEKFAKKNGSQPAQIQ